MMRALQRSVLVCAALPAIGALTSLAAAPIPVVWSYRPAGAEVNSSFGSLHFQEDVALLQDRGHTIGDPVIGLDLSSGRERWRLGPVSSYDVRFGGAVFTAPLSGRLHVFEAVTGRDLGALLPNGDEARVLSIVAREIYATTDNSLVRIDNPGSLVWNTRFSDLSAGRPNEHDLNCSVIGERVYVSISGPQPGLSALDRGNGRVLWKHGSLYADNMDIGRDVRALPEGLLLAETAGATSRSIGMLSLLDPDTGRVRARYPAQGALGLNGVPGGVVFGDYAGRIFRTSMIAGRGVWYYSSFNLAEGNIYPDDISMQVTLLSNDDERVYFVAALTNQNALVALSVETGATVWRFSPPGLSPAQAVIQGDARTLTLNGLVYSFWMDRAGRALLVAVDAGSGLERGRSAPLPGSFADEMRGPYLHNGALYGLLGDRLVRFSPLAR